MGYASPPLVSSVAVAPDTTILHVVELAADGKTVGDFDLSDNGVWSSDTWSKFSDVQAVAGFGSEAQHVAMTYAQGDMQLAFSTQYGGLAHATRHYDGSWQRLGNVESVAGNVNSGQVTLAGYTF
ncbi:hypothetical protein [Kutzneria sp. CA-103260]|uniref:hypothetical protein n=1 Tax=Kutzneria sp. CA-103260 TaxID=2802641 RepID=UPI001BAA0845|nr:hypothetical protein [Kutzneria sp. CA-103260]QUQ67516.1 hypothetical protein JJ691_52510 [Kutzneria sp. CA-103260]